MVKIRSRKNVSVNYCYIHESLKGCILVKNLHLQFWRLAKFTWKMEYLKKILVLYIWSELRILSRSSIKDPDFKNFAPTWSGSQAILSFNITNLCIKFTTHNYVFRLVFILFCVIEVKTQVWIKKILCFFKSPFI